MSADLREPRDGFCEVIHRWLDFFGTGRPACSRAKRGQSQNGANSKVCVMVLEPGSRAADRAGVPTRRCTGDSQLWLAMLVSAMQGRLAPGMPRLTLFPLDVRPIARAACASGAALSGGRRRFQPRQLIVASSESTIHARAVRGARGRFFPPVTLKSETTAWSPAPPPPPLGGYGGALLHCGHSGYFETPRSVDARACVLPFGP